MLAAKKRALREMQSPRPVDDTYGAAPKGPSPLSHADALR
jgi:hypothetical protein